MHRACFQNFRERESSTRATQLSHCARTVLRRRLLSREDAKGLRNTICAVRKPQILYNRMHTMYGSYSKHPPFFWVEPSPTSTIKVTKRQRPRREDRNLTLKQRHQARDRRVQDFMHVREFSVLAPREVVHEPEIVTPGFDSLYCDEVAPVGSRVKTATGVIVTRGDVSVLLWTTNYSCSIVTRSVLVLTSCSSDSFAYRLALLGRGGEGLFLLPRGKLKLLKRRQCGAHEQYQKSILSLSSRHFHRLQS